MTTRRKPTAVKVSKAQRDETNTRVPLLVLWEALQAVAENPTKKLPPKSIEKLNSFNWTDSTKEMGLQGTMLALIDRVLIDQGFRRSTFDSFNLNHQYVDRQKRLFADVAATRLGVAVHVKAEQTRANLSFVPHPPTVD